MKLTTSPTHSLNEYLSETVRVWLGLDKHLASQIPQLPERLVNLLLRKEEYDTQCRDFFGGWEFGYSDSFWEGNLWKPEIDLWIKEEREKLHSKGYQLQPQWPNGKSFAVNLTHDVDQVGDTYAFSRIFRNLKLALSENQSVKKMIRPVARSLIKPFIPKTALRLDALNDFYQIEKDLNVSSSYFFTVYPIKGKKAPFDCNYSPKDRSFFQGKKRTTQEIMQILHDQGFDVGLHGSYYSALDPKMLEDQKTFLEKALNHSISSTRQHWLNFQVDKTPQYQCNAGLKVDSTLGFNRNIGYRTGTSLPFFWYDLSLQKKIDLLQVPLIWQEGATYSSSGLELDEALIRKLFLKFVEGIKKVNGCLTILYHPDYQYQNKNHLQTYKWMIEHCLENNAWVTSLNGINQWWRQKAKS